MTSSPTSEAEPDGSFEGVTSSSAISATTSGGDKGRGDASHGASGGTVAVTASGTSATTPAGATTSGASNSSSLLRDHADAEEGLRVDAVQTREAVAFPIQVPVPVPSANRKNRDRNNKSVAKKK